MCRLVWSVVDAILFAINLISGVDDPVVPYVLGVAIGIGVVLYVTKLSLCSSSLYSSVVRGFSPGSPEKCTTN